MPDETPEQLKDYMTSITNSLAPAEISGWLKRVAELAQKKCPDCRIEYRPGGDFGDIVIPTRAGRSYVIDAIKAHEKQAPELVRTILVSYRAKLENN